MMHILNWFSMCFGLIPLNRIGTHDNFSIDYVLMVIVPIFYIFCYVLISVFNIFSLNSLPGCGSICSLANALFIHLGAVLYIFTALQSIYRRKRFFVQFDKCLCAIDDLIQKCRKVADLDKAKLTAGKHGILYHFTWLLVCAVFVFALYYDIKETYISFGEYAFIPVMVSSFPFLAGSIIQGEFIYHVSIISDRFTQINRLFEKINQEARHKHIPVTVYDIESDGKKVKISPFIKSTKLAGNQQQFGAQDKAKYIDDKIESEDEDDFDDDDDYDYDEAGVVDTGLTSETNLPDLFNLHDKILSLSVLTNCEFGPQCVPYMAACFVISIFGIFLETKVNFIVSGKNRYLDYITELYVIWSITTMCVAYLVLRLCCNANNQSKQSAMIVHEIMQKKPAFMLSNDLFYNKMKAFTLQFLHWEGYFHFNGIGLFALDYTFIFSTVSAATSYLIVLLQFDMTTILKNEGLIS